MTNFQISQKKNRSLIAIISRDRNTLYTKTIAHLTLIKQSNFTNLYLNKSAKKLSIHTYCKGKYYKNSFTY